MIESIKNWRTDKRGFTLIELIISMLVFTIFMGVVATVYISVTRSLRHASEVRKVYAEARFLMDKVTQDVRLYTVDYDCLDGTIDLGENSTHYECSAHGATFDWVTGQSTVLPLISADGTHRVVYRFIDGVFAIYEGDYNGSSWDWSDGYYGGFQDFVSDSVLFDDIHFDIYPVSSPYDGGPQFQPSVHTVIGATSRSAFLPDQLTIILQSTISSRVYGVSF